MKSPIRFFLLFLAFVFAAPVARAIDHSVTAASVLQSDAASLEDGIAGEAITVGMAVYKDAANSNVIKMAQCDGTSAQADVVGIALTTASAAGQPVKYARSDVSFTPGFSINSGVAVYLSATFGKLCPVADLASTNYGVVIGIGIGSNKIKLYPLKGGALP